MRIAFLTPQLPHPPVSGGVIKTRKLVDYLAERHQVYLLTLLKGDDREHQDAFLEAASLDGYGSVKIDVPRTARVFLRSLFAGLPLSVFRNRSLAMTEKVSEVMWWQPDVIFIDHFLMFQYVLADYSGPVILHQHNAEHVMWERFAKLQRNPVRKVVVMAEARRVRAYERRICVRADALLASPNDAAALSELGIPRMKFIETLHLGDEALLNAADIEFSGTGLELLSVGTLDWEANRDGLLWFLKEVWPDLKGLHPSLGFAVVGRNPGPELAELAARLPGVKLTGFVDDLGPFYEKARVFVAPLRFGSGMKVKVINALYRGVPVVTTGIGAEGLDVTSGKELVIANEKGEMVREISDLLSNEGRWRGMRDASRALARSRYTWNSSLAMVETAITAAVARQ